MTDPAIPETLLRSSGSGWLARIRIVLEVAVMLAVLAASALIIRALWNQPNIDPPVGSSLSSFPLPMDLVSVAGAPLLGDPRTSAVLVIYSDFECPFCGRFARETLPRIVSDYVDDGRLAIVFKHLPLERIHPFARTAAAAGVCADRQGKFWSWHDALFAGTSKPDKASLDRAVTEAGGDLSEFQRCLELQETNERVTRDLTEATTLKIRSDLPPKSATRIM